MFSNLAGIIFDLDDTIYNYTECHDAALRTCITFLCEKTEIGFDTILQQYNKIAKQLKDELPGIASSHNKSIYFKQLLENLGLSYTHFIHINDLYWRTFYNRIRPFDGVREYIEWNRKMGIKIGVLTDYETEYQIIKLEKLGLLELVDHIVTSEEIGIEKPSKRAFLTILDQMKLRPEDVCMIGDNYKKDICGAFELGIRGLWFCPSPLPSDIQNGSFGSFGSLLNESIEFHKKLVEFVEISRYCGERLDLVQAGGGNVSVKIGDNMIIKSSGIHMANITAKNGYSIVNNRELKADMENSKESKYITSTGGRPSIETYMHSILKTYTVHLHPIQVNRILVTTDARQIITQLFPESCIMDYYTPGFDIAMALTKQYRDESVIFLINHGIIITTDNYSEIRPLLEKVLMKCEEYQGLDFAKYKIVNQISQLVSEKNCAGHLTFLATNRDIYYLLENHRCLFSELHTFPDALIYCGMRILDIPTFDGGMKFPTKEGGMREDEVRTHADFWQKNGAPESKRSSGQSTGVGLLESEIDLYRKTYFELPKIIIYEENLYIISTTYQKCKEIEDVLAANLWILYSDSKKQYLSESEIQYLNGWDAEKYRKNVT